ncbi:redoxin family protein, partial [Emticicia sp. ODNR4P]|nr:redoxin family protein [Emticicia sp. ODNR4P]
GRTKFAPFHNTYLKLKNITLFKLLISTIFGEAYTLSELLKENKLTYVDFWASWCGPCRVEVPHSKKLQEKYEKDINFIYLSIDQNATQWKTAINQLALPLKKNFLITNPKNNTLIQKYKVISIPRYMIIDAKGVVINQNAPRPSDPRLIKVFNELLKK